MSEHVYPSAQEIKPRKTRRNKAVNRVEAGLEIVFLISHLAKWGISGQVMWLGRACCILLVR
jgi:hypothetical protein